MGRRIVLRLVIQPKLACFESLANAICDGVGLDLIHGVLREWPRARVPQATAPAWERSGGSIALSYRNENTYRIELRRDMRMAIAVSVDPAVVADQRFLPAARARPLGPLIVMGARIACL